jgi:hypothetical protein
MKKLMMVAVLVLPFAALAGNSAVVAKMDKKAAKSECVKDGKKGAELKKCISEKTS